MKMGARNATTFCGDQIVLDMEGIALERREPIRPGIGVLARIDQVLMRV